MNQKQIKEHLQQTCYIELFNWRGNCTKTLLNSDKKSIVKLTDKQYESIKSNYTLKSIDSEIFTPIKVYEIVPK